MYISTNQLCLICFFIGQICQLNASNLTLTVYPQFPKELMTSLELTCTFEGQQLLEGKSNYLPYYMHILNDKQTLLGVISSHRPAVVKFEKEKLQVEGRLSSNSSDTRVSYLKLTWKRPRSEHGGDYTCTAHARNEDALETLFTTTASVSVQKPSSEEVMTFLHNEAAIVDKINDKNEMYYQEQVQNFENIINVTKKNYETMQNFMALVEKKNIPTSRME